jgi:hypothetical protein
VIRRHVLAALAVGIRAGDEDAARAALRGTDWIVRGTARRRLERALIDAELATLDNGTVTPVIDEESSRHVQRLAALEVAGADDVDATDRARVAEAYGALPAVAPPKLPVATILAGALAAAMLAMLAVTVVAWRRGATHDAPPVTGAFRDSGEPMREPAIEKLLAEELGDLVVAIDGDPDKPAPDLRSPPALLPYPGIARAWGDMIGALHGWARVPRHGRAFRDASNQLRAKVRAVSEELAAAGLGYYLQGDVLAADGRDHAAITAYRVDRVVFVVADGEPQRVLDLRRLDKLNLHRPMLGMQSEGLGDPVVLLDQIDHHVATRLMPVLADNQPYAIGDDAWVRTPEGRSLQFAVGAAIRREARPLLGPDATQVSALLVERDAYIERWRDDLERRRIWMTATDDVMLPAGLLAKLDGFVPPPELERVRAIEAELARLDAPRIAARARTLVAATVRRHEAQHAVDAPHHPRHYPDALARRLAALPVDDEFSFRANAELRAYLSQIANDPHTPQHALWSVTRHSFQREPNAEAFAGLVIVEGLARQLGIAPPGPAFHGGRLDRAVLAWLATELAARSGDELRIAAKTLWLQLYDGPVPVIVDRELPAAG